MFYQVTEWPYCELHNIKLQLTLVLHALVRFDQYPVANRLFNINKIHYAKNGY